MFLGEFEIADNYHSVLEPTDWRRFGECAEKWDLLRCIAKYSHRVSSFTGSPRCQNQSILLASSAADTLPQVFVFFACCV